MTPPDERPTCPPAADDAAADAFVGACRERGEWVARLEHLARRAALVDVDVADPAE